MAKQNRSKLPPGQEASFREWYKRWADVAGIDPDPDNPLHKYDYRSAYLAGAEPIISDQDGKYHWPSQFKADDHPNRFVGGVDTKTGKKKPPPPPPPGSVEAFRKKRKAAAEPKKPFEFAPDVPRLSFGYERTSPLTGEPYMEPVSIEDVQRSQGITPETDKSIRQTPSRAEQYSRDILDIVHAPGKSLNAAISAAKSGEPLEAVLQLGKGFLEAPALPFGVLTRMLKEAPGGETLVKAIEYPFELASEAVVGGTNLIAQTGIDEFAEQTLRASGITDEDVKSLQRAGKTLGEINQILAQYAIAAGAHKGGNLLSNQITRMQAEASRPIQRIPGEEVPFTEELGPTFRKVGEAAFERDRPTLPQPPKLLPEKATGPRKAEHYASRTIEVGPGGEARVTGQKPVTPRKAPTRTPSPKQTGESAALIQQVETIGIGATERPKYEKAILEDQAKTSPQLKATRPDIDPTKLTDAELLRVIDDRNLWPTTPLNEVPKAKLYDLVDQGWITPEEAFKALKEEGTVNKLFVEDIKKQAEARQIKKRGKKAGEKAPPPEPKERPAPKVEIKDDAMRPVDEADQIRNIPTKPKSRWVDGAEPIAAVEGEAIAYLDPNPELTQFRATIEATEGGFYRVFDSDGIQLKGETGHPAIFNSVADAKAAAEKAFAPDAKMYELSKKIPVFDVPLEDIVVRAEDFQTRENPYAKKSVESIKDDFYNGEWNYQAMDPILLWEDPKTKILHPINHSRLQAFQELFNEGNKEFGQIPSKIVKDMPFEQAKKMADKSNKLATLETPLERATYYRDMKKAGKSFAEILREAKKLEGEYGALAMINLSHVNPTGRLADAIRGIAGGEEVTVEVKHLLTMAEWIGDARRRHPELTNVHENEMFRWLHDNYGAQGQQITSRAEFVSVIDQAMKNQAKGSASGEFLPNKPINIKDVQHRSPAEIEHLKKVNALQKQHADKAAEIRRENDKLAANGVKRQEREKQLQPLYAELNRIHSELMQATSREVDQLGQIRSIDLDLFNQTPETYSDAYKQAFRRLREKGLIDPNILRAGPPIDPARVKYVLDPIMKKVFADASQLVERGMLDAKDVVGWMQQRAKEMLVDNPEKYGIKGVQELAEFNRLIQKELNRLKYNPLLGEVRTPEREKFDAAIRESMGDVVTEELPETQRSEGSTKPNPLYRDNMKSLTSANLHTAGTYVAKQGIPDANGITPGRKLVDLINNADREAAQEAGKSERAYRLNSSKPLNNAEFDEFVTLANEGGTSTNPKVQAALESHRAETGRVIEAAQSVGMEETIPITEVLLDGEQRVTFKEVPIRRMKHYWPREYDKKALKDPQVRKTMIERIAEENNLTMVEAERAFNEFMKSKYEVKYGHLERPRTFDLPGWSRKRDVMPTYYERAWRRIKQREYLGKKYQNAADLIEQIAKDGGDYQAAQIMLDRWLGKEEFVNKLDRQLIALARYTGSWQVATKLQLLSLLNWTQLNNVGLYTGTYELVKGTLETAGNYKNAVKFAEEAGAILESTISMHMKEALSYDGIGGKALKWTGVTPQERVLRIFASNIMANWAKGRVPELSRPKVFGEMQRFLEKMNLQNKIDLNKVKSRGFFTEKELLDIGYEGARATQFLTRTQDVQFIISDPRFKMFTQFKAFVSQQTKLLYDTVIKEARNGNYKPARHLLLAFPVAGAVASGLRDFVRQRDMKNFFQRENEDLLQSVLRYYATVGGLSILYDMYSSAQHAPSAALEFFTGPTGSDISRGLYSLTQLIQAKPKTKPIAGWLARQIPVPVFQQAAIHAASDKSATKSPFGEIGESPTRKMFDFSEEGESSFFKEGGEGGGFFPE